MKQQVAAASHFQQLVREITGAFLRDELNGLLQPRPLRFSIQACFTQGDNSRMHLNAFGKSDKVTDIHGHDNQALRVGIAPDLNIRLSLQADMRGGTGFQPLRIGPNRKQRREIFINQQFQSPSV